jgi:hypothetical protein
MSAKRLPPICRAAGYEGSVRHFRRAVGRDGKTGPTQVPAQPSATPDVQDVARRGDRAIAAPLSLETSRTELSRIAIRSPRGPWPSEIWVLAMNRVTF